MSIQLHLWVSHASVLGAISALVILLAAHRTGTETIYVLGYGFVLAAAAAAAISYFSGPEAYELLELLEPTIEKSYVENHAVFGKAGFVVMMLVGVLDLGALMQYMQGEVPSRLQRWSVLVGLALAVLILVWSAHLGGLIRHPEIRGLF